MGSERRLAGVVCVRFLGVLSVALLASSAADSADTPVRPAGKILPDTLLDECLKRGKSYAECGLSARRLLQGWIDNNYDPKTKLIFRKSGNRRLRWDYHDVAADYHSSLVLISHYVAPEYNQPGARLHQTLLSSKNLCTLPNGIPGVYYFDTGKVEGEATYLALSEWLRDGLIRIAENLGTDNVWYEEMCRLSDAMIRVAHQRGGLYQECSRSTEALGNMLQSLARLYVMSGERRYLEAAEEIGDALLLDPNVDTFRRMVERRDSFRDHGCEMIPGLAELFVVECKLDSGRAKSYRRPLMRVLDQILQTSAHPKTGLFCGDLDKDGNTVWLQPPDTWGYVLFSYENFDRATGTGRYRKAIEKPIRWLLDNRKDFEQCREAKLWPQAAHRDTWSDSHESMIILANRLGMFDQQVFQWLDWMTLQSEHRRHLDKQYGPYLNAHDDGSTGRCLCTHMMACSRGVRHVPFQEGLRIGGMPFADGLLLSLESAKPYQGKLRFDWPRGVYPTGTLDWARLNEMPAWFVVEPEKEYSVTVNGSPEKVMLGQQLIDGLSVAVEPGVIGTVCVEQVETHTDCATQKPTKTDGARPWWSSYHTLVSHSTHKEGQEWELGMMAERGGWPTGWYGAWWIRHQLQRRGIYDAIKHVEHFRDRGVKNVFYFDVGELGEFVALVRDGELIRNQWELRFYRDEPGELIWFGKDGFYRDESPLNLECYRDFGLPPWTLPDGTRPERLYDLARTSLDGKRDPWDYSSVRVSPEIARALDLDTFLRSGPDPVPPEAKGSLGRICSYDHSNPFLLEDFKAGVGMMLSLKPAFIHFDNYFDNETVYPLWQAFGPWSIERFRRFAAEHVDEAKRRELDIGDPRRFDLRQYILDKPFESRGHRWHFHNKRWHDDPVWNLFVSSKLADSDELFRRLYAFCKTESRRQGSEVVVVGNTIPIFPGGSLVSGAIDVAHFEHHAATQYGPVVVPTGLPPLGRLGGIVRLGAAVSTAGYCWPSVYVPKQLSGPGHENLHKVMAMDCLANKGVLDYNHQYREGYSPGSDESAAWANCFIKSFSSYYGSREALPDVALVFPGQTVLASVSVFTMDPEACLYDYLGWAQALTELHFPWDALPDDRLSLKRIQPFKIVVLPSAASLSDEAIDAILAYVEGGGRLVISGEAGTRYGLERFLWHRDAGETLMARLSSGGLLPRDGSVKPGDTPCILCPDAPGKTFYIDVADGERSDGRPRINEAIRACLADTPVQVETDAPDTVGVFSFREPNGAVAVDLVNYQVDPPTDRLVPAKEVRLVIRPTPGRQFTAPRATLISPDLRTAAESAAEEKPPTPWNYEPAVLTGRLHSDGALELTVPEFDVYCTVSVPTRPDVE